MLSIIDPGVDNYQDLVAGVIPGSEVIVLDSNRDGVAQITEAVQGRSDIAEIHIVSHGSPGCLYLGNSQLSLDTLNRYAQQLKTWVAPSLLLYGCNVAAGDAGEEFIAKLHALTGANIAASAKRTGSAAKGGDWELEVVMGELQSALAFKPEVMATYSGVLVAPPNDDFADAIELTGTSGTVFGTNVDATAESGEANAGNRISVENSVWWKWTAPCDGLLTVDTEGSGNSDPQLAIYTGQFVNSLTFIAFNEDGGTGYQSLIEDLNVIGGTTYSIQIDGYSGTAGTITLNYDFDCSNQPPVAVDDSATAAQNTPETILAADLLANDTDADGDPLTLTAVSNAVDGTVSLDTNGDVVFTPNTGFSGPASFEYTVSDGTNTDTATVTVEVGTNLTGTNQSDTLPGSAGDDFISGGNSADELNGLGGDDTLLGGNGKDTLNGGDGNDLLLGEESELGGNGKDILNGGAGNDTLLGGNGADVLNGGLGDDELTGGNGDDTFILAAGESTDTITDFGDGPDVIGLSGGLTFEDLTFSGNDILLKG